MPDLSQLHAMRARTLDKLASGWRRFSRTIPQLIYSLYIDENPEYRACTLVAGSGRGGTTWLTEIINYDNSYRFMFEPFHCSHVPRCQVFGEQQYLRPEDNDPKFLVPARSIFSGRLRNGWVDLYNRRFRSTRRLVKDIRVNLMLGWIRVHFPEIPIILLLRHPCAVAYSRCRLGWNDDLESTFLAQDKLMKDYLQPFQSAIKQAQGEFERQIFWWCIETYVPLMQFGPEEILVTTYENCVISPGSELRRIFGYLQRPFDDDILTTVAKPSSQSRRNWRSGNASAIISGKGVVDGWKSSVDQRDSRSALEILKLFGLDKIYSLDPQPDFAAIERFMRTNGGNLNQSKT